jgi:hypothetical protein
MNKLPDPFHLNLPALSQMEEFGNDSLRSQKRNGQILKDFGTGPVPSVALVQNGENRSSIDESYDFGGPVF